MSELVLPIGTLIVLILAVAGGSKAYGRLEMKTDAAHRRIDELKADVDKKDAKIEKKLEEIVDGITEINLALARLGAPTKEKS